MNSRLCRQTFLSPISLRYFVCTRVTQNLALRSYRKLPQTPTLSFVLLRQVFATNGTWNLGLGMEITTHNPFRASSNTRFKFCCCECLRKPLVILRFSWHEALLFQDLSLVFVVCLCFLTQTCWLFGKLSGGSLRYNLLGSLFQVFRWFGVDLIKILSNSWELQSAFTLFKPCKTSFTDTLSSLMLWITFNNV